MSSVPQALAAELPDRYALHEVLAENAEELLVAARDTVLARDVVLKAPGPAVAGLLAAAGDRERALREARALARVRSGGVAQLLEVLETRLGPVLVLEPVAGESLAEHLARRRAAGERMTAGEVVELGRKLAAALADVHGAGIVHRGLSLGNVLLDARGEPRLVGFTFAKPDLHGGATSIDYGAARRGATGDGEVTRPRLVPAHPAPEQLGGRAADARSDLFALGCVLYECVTGNNPFPVDDLAQRVAPPAPARVDRAVPGALSDAIMRCLAPSPLKRFQSAGELRAVLDEIAAGAAQGGPAVGAPRRARWPLPAAAVVIAALAGGLLWQLGDGGGSGAGTERGAVLADGEARTDASGVDPDLLPRYASSHALLIGIGEAYADNRFLPLSNAEADVAALAERLREMTWERWEVTTLTGREATHQNILGALRAIERRAGRDDRVLVYYAGHGEPHERAEESGWIIPADAPSEQADPSRSRWIRFDEFGRFFDETAAKHVLVAMDCCYSGRLAAPRSASPAAYRERYLRSEAHVVITSGRPFEQVSDGVPGEHSPFARAFLSALRRDDATALTSSALFQHISDAFLEEGVGHTPQLACPPGSALGQFVFFLGE